MPAKQRYPSQTTVRRKPKQAMQVVLYQEISPPILCLSHLQTFRHLREFAVCRAGIGGTPARCNNSRVNSRHYAAEFLCWRRHKPAD